MRAIEPGFIKCGSRTASISELTRHRQRVGGFQEHELLATVGQATANSLRCHICKLVVHEAIRMDNAAGPMRPCGHFFCSSCLTHKFVQLRAGASEFEGFACPACGRFVRAVLADPSLDSVVLTLLTPGIHVHVAVMAQDHTCSTLFHSSTKSSSSGTKKVGVKCAAGFRAWPGALRTIGDATLRCSRATVIGHDQDGLQRSQPRRMREFAAKHSQFQEPVSTTSFPSHCNSLSSEPKIQTPPQKNEHATKSSMAHRAGLLTSCRKWTSRSTFHILYR